MDTGVGDVGPVLSEAKSLVGGAAVAPGALGLAEEVTASIGGDGSGAEDVDEATGRPERTEVTGSGLAFAEGVTEVDGADVAVGTICVAFAGEPVVINEREVAPKALALVEASTALSWVDEAGGGDVGEITGLSEFVGAEGFTGAVVGTTGAGGA